MILVVFDVDGVFVDVVYCCYYFIGFCCSWDVFFVVVGDDLLFGEYVFEDVEVLVYFFVVLLVLFMCVFDVGNFVVYVMI